MTLRTTGFLILLASAGASLACQHSSEAEQLPLSEPFANAEAKSAILKALPPEWSLHEAREDELPWGHFNTGSGGELLVLVGPQPIDFLWRAGDEPWHRAPIAQESLELWMLPGGYRPAPRRPNEHHPPVPPVEIFDGESVTVYGRISHVITELDQFDSLLREASSTSWSDIPNKSLSWATWRQDLAKALQEYDSAEP